MGFINDFKKWQENKSRTKQTKTEIMIERYSTTKSEKILRDCKAYFNSRLDGIISTIMLDGKVAKENIKYRCSFQLVSKEYCDIIDADSGMTDANKMEKLNDLKNAILSKKSSFVGGMREGICEYTNIQAYIFSSMCNAVRQNLDNLIMVENTQKQAGYLADCLHLAKQEKEEYVLPKISKNVIDKVQSNNDTSDTVSPFYLWDRENNSNDELNK